MVLLSWNSHSSPAICCTGFFSAGLPTCQNTATQAAAERSAAPANTFQVSAAPYSRPGMGRPKPRDRDSTPPRANRKTREYLVMALSGCMWTLLGCLTARFILNPDSRGRARKCLQYRPSSAERTDPSFWAFFPTSILQAISLELSPDSSRLSSFAAHRRADTHLP